jgi:hypothetical protein
MEVDRVVGLTGGISACAWLTAQQVDSGISFQTPATVDEELGDDPPRV